MSVSVLLCEGDDGGADIRLLKAILPGSAVGEVRASGGKDGFRNLIRNLRRAGTGGSVCGLSDGDFPRKPTDWTPAPPCREWRARIDGAETMLGWMWRRKEIENYFIDPDILARALQWDVPRKSAYATALEDVLDKLACMTAGRIALTAHAPRRTRLETELRIDAAEVDIVQALRGRAGEYNQDARVDESALIGTYEWCRSECLPGGKFRASALEVFAGKDILAKIQQTAGFPPELKNRERLIERILLALDRDPAPHTWLPEWSALRSAVEAWSP